MIWPSNNSSTVPKSLQRKASTKKATSETQNSKAGCGHGTHACHTTEGGDYPHPTINKTQQTGICAPFMALINPEKLSLLTILELMRLQGSGGISLGMKTTRALVSVGKSIENEYKAQMCKKYDIPVPQLGFNKTTIFVGRVSTLASDEVGSCGIDGIWRRLVCDMDPVDEVAGRCGFG
jgi:hypothetical protein